MGKTTQVHPISENEQFPRNEKAAEQAKRIGGKVLNFFKEHGIIGIQGDVGSPAGVSGSVTYNINHGTTVSAGGGFPSGGFNVMGGVGLRGQLGNPGPLTYNVTGGLAHPLHPSPAIGYQFSISRSGISGHLMFGPGWGIGATGSVTVNQTEK